MGSIIGKRRGGRTYYYYAESARVDGRPRIVGQRYLGTAEEVAGSLGGPAADPERTRHLAYGDVAAVWRTIGELDLAGIADAALGRQRAAVPVGTHLALAVLARAAGPKAQSADAARVLRPRPPEQACEPGLRRRALRRLGPEQLARIEQGAAGAVRARLGVADELPALVVDVSNQAAADPLAATGLLVTRDGAIPLHAHEHRRGSGTRFGEVAGALAARHRAGGPAEVTAVFDAGTHPHPESGTDLGFVGGLLPAEHPELLAHPASARTAVDPDRLPGLSALDTRAVVDGVTRRVVITHSETLHAAQSRGFAEALHQAARRLDGLAEALAAGDRRSREQVLAEIARITRVRWGERVLVTALEGSRPGELRLRWYVDEPARQRVAEEFFGKQLLVTDRDTWPVARLITAYRARYHLDSTFARLADPAAAEPEAVRGLISRLAVAVLHLMRHRVGRAGLDMSVRELFEQLGGIELTELRYRSTGGRPRTRRVLSEPTEVQQRLLDAFGLDR